MKKRKKKVTVKYSKIILVLSFFCFLIMIARILQLSLSKTVDGVNLKKLAAQRTTKTEVLPATRGNIYSKFGDVLAQNVSSYKLIAYLDPKRTVNSANPQHVVDKEKTATLLSPILGLSTSEIMKYLSKDNIYQTEFGPKGAGLNEITKKQIEDLNLPGLSFIESAKRYYPKGDFASYTIGYTSLVDDVLVGQMGIEKYYDKILRGKDGYVTYQKDLKGYKIAGTYEDRKEAISGKDIYLTLDSNIEFYVEQALNNVKANYSFEWFNVTILDAKTGALLAAVTSPSFDPNIKNITNYLDYTVASPYEPGSTMKTFTYMAAMENGVYNGSETYHSGTYTTTDGTVIGDWNRNGWGDLTFDKGYAMSSNVGVINLINRHMSALMLRQYFHKLGFGKKTGITLPLEQAGSLGFKYETEIFNAGFGQGITTTPIQNVQALTPLTNDGILLKPYVVSKIVDPNTKTVILENKREEKERVASTATVEKMLSLMNDCVNGIGNTGSGYRIPSGELIGKTGTAQIADEKSGGYLSGKEDIISSFSGIYPKSSPEIIIYASVKRPSGGSQKPISTAVKEIVNNISKYYGHEAETPSVTVSRYKVANYINNKTDNIKTILDSAKVTYSVLGNGSKIIGQYPKTGSVVTNFDRIYLITNSVQTVPDVNGLASIEAKGVLKELGLKVNLNGTGYVVSQSVSPGTAITSGMEITLTLNPKFSE